VVPLGKKGPHLTFERVGHQRSGCVNPGRKREAADGKRRKTAASLCRGKTKKTAAFTRIKLYHPTREKKKGNGYFRHGKGKDAKKKLVHGPKKKGVKILAGERGEGSWDWLNQEKRKGKGPVNPKVGR